MALTARAARELAADRIAVNVVQFLCAEAPDYLTGEFISLRGGRL